MIHFSVNPPENWNREDWANQCQHEIACINRDLQRCEEYQRFREGKERELRNYPVNNDKGIQNLKEFIEKKINYYHKDLIDSYFQMFVDKISRICPEDKDYSRTISSVYTNKNSKTVMKVISSFFGQLQNELMTLVMNIKRVQCNKFCRIQKLLQNCFLDIIAKLYGTIYDFIERKVYCIDEDEEMSDSKAVKVYAEMVIGELNQKLINELPHLLNEVYREQVEWTKEDLSIKWEREFDIPWGLEKKEERMLVNEEPIVEEANPQGDIQSFKAISRNEDQRNVN